VKSLLYLFRHGQAAPPGILAGRTEYPLSSEGEAQADRWRMALSDVTFGIARTSPLARARQTAARILSGNSANTRSLLPVPGLTEISLGEWEGKSKEWVRRTYPVEWEARGRDFVHVSPPGGESFAELADRVRPAFEALRSEAAGHACSLLVAHQAVNRVILGTVLGLPLAEAVALAQPPGALTVLEITATGARVVERHAVPFIRCRRTGEVPRQRPFQGGAELPGQMAGVLDNTETEDERCPR
jgi:probable phosphoglycerate mutase